VSGLGLCAAYAKQNLRDEMVDHKAYIDKDREDIPEIRNWQWGNPM
jgi:xylulose-5-phosphate/fructose-6-phosphate phosphoketolase